MSINTMDTVDKFGYIISGNDFVLPQEGRYKSDHGCVPRVTEVLEATINEPYIAEWANWLGFRHKSYRAALGEAAATGTKTHSYIEHVIKEGEGIIPESDEDAQRCIGAFNRWWAQLIANNKVEVIGQEQKIVCQYFGGTYDMLMKINDKVYLIDFKTSSKVSFRYFMQLAAYKYMIEPSYNLHVDACMVLRLDKKSGVFEETIVDVDDQEGKAFMDDCLSAFFACLSAYYFRQKIESYNLNRFTYKGDDVDDL